MHTIIHALAPRRPFPAGARSTAYRRPHYDCQEEAGALKLVVYVPGADPAGMELEVRGPDLIVTAPKTRPVRTNWRALQLENVQHDYHLRLRLGYNLDYSGLEASLREAVLTIRIPKKSAAAAA